MKNDNNKQTTPEPTAANAPSDHAQALVLPLMKSVDDAYELCRLEQDDFYMSAFMIQTWLGQATLAVSAEYAEKKEPRTRALQSGQTWRSFAEIIASCMVGRVCEPDVPAPRAPSTEPVSQTSEPAAPQHDADVRPDDLDKEQLCHFVAAIFRFTEYEDPYAVIVRAAVGGYLIEHGPLSETAYTKQVIENPVPILLRLCESLCEKVLSF